LVGRRRSYAVQKPKGRHWETLALVDSLVIGRQEFKEAIRVHGTGYVRLIQVDFQGEDALSNYDWRLVELHDPFKGKAPPRPTVIAASERPTPAKARARTGSGTGGMLPSGTPGAGRRAGEKVPVPFPTYLAALMIGALGVTLWTLWFGF